MKRIRSFAPCLLVLLLAGCGGTAAVSTSPSPSTPSSTPASAKPPASSAAAAASGSTAASASAAASSAAAVSSAPPAASSAPASSSALASGAAATSSAPGAPIKIGYLMPLAGTEAQNGIDNRDGYNLFLSQGNDTVAGHKIETTFADSEGKPDVALTKAKQLVEQDKVNALMGISFTPPCYAVATYVQQAHVPFLVNGNCGGSGLTTDPKFKSDYLFRYTQALPTIILPGVNWATDNAHKNVTLISSDYAAGLQVSDFFAQAFIEKGGTVVQELHPALGTADFGPFLAQLNPQADTIALFLPGADALRFAQQYASYSNQKRLVIDMAGQATAGSALEQLKDKVAGWVGSSYYTVALPGTMNQDFVKAYQAKYGRPVSPDAAQGYAGAQILVGSLKKVDGKVAGSDLQGWLSALAATNLDTVKGPVKLDQYHDIVEDGDAYQIEQSGSQFVPKLLKAYPNVTQFGNLTEEQYKRLPLGQMKGKWVGMTKAKLDAMLAG